VIEFLAAQGVPLRTLMTVQQKACDEGVCIARAYMSVTGEAEERFYRRLARHLRLRYVDSVPGLRVRNAESALTIGLAEIESKGSAPSYLFAPEPERLGEVLSVHRRQQLPNCRLYLTAPRRFRAFILMFCAPQISRSASSALRRFDPDLTAEAASRKSVAAFIGGLLLLILICSAPRSPWPVAWLYFLGATLLKLCAAAVSGGRPVAAPPLSDAELPVYTVLAPLYREARVLQKLLDSLAALDYPGIMAQTPQELRPGSTT
jgi:glycosyltransferase XagB